MTKDQLKQLEDDLWRAADNLRANSDLKSSEYSTPVLGLIFLKFADVRFKRASKQMIAKKATINTTSRRQRPLIADRFQVPDNCTNRN